MKNKAILMMKTLTPTHAGSGTQISYVDLPIQRESHTGFPKIEASTLKGCIRAAIVTEHGNKPEIDNLFGERNNPEFASAVSFSDARLLFFPVKSAIGIFAYITCPYVIQRFIEDCAIVEDNSIKNEIEEKLKEMSNQTKGDDKDKKTSAIHDVNESQESQVVCTHPKSKCVLNIGKDNVVLEDYTYNLKEDEAFGFFLEALKKQYPILSEGFQSRALRVSDDDFCQFVKYSTEIATRIKINPETGTVDNSALFTEEFLPPESILYSVVICSNYHMKDSEKDNNDANSVEDNKISEGNNVADNVADNGTSEEKKNEPDALNDLIGLFDMDIFQIGADSTLGKGLVKKILKQVK